MPSARFAAALLLVLGGLTPPARLAAQPAALDPEPNSPYQWRVVVQAKPHPLLSPAFRDQLRRDLLAALQPALGPLGTVDVLDLDALPADRRDPLIQDFASKGFAALDAPRDLSGQKTHFLRVEVKDGAYQLESRHYDGFAGIASPVVRRQTVPAPELVGRAAGLMIDRDFGLAGTVEPATGKDEAVVRFRGAKLGPLDRHVAAGDILAVSRIAKSEQARSAPVARSATGRVIGAAPGAAAPAALTPAPLPFTLLRVTKVSDESAECQALTGYKDGAFPKARGTAGFRALKLGTVSGPAAVRLAAADGTRAAAAGVTVRATDAGFAGDGDAKDFLDANPQDGVFRGGRALKGVACVTVTLGATRTARFPVAVVGPDPVPLPFEVDQAAEDRAVFERSVLAASSRTADARNAQRGCFQEVSDQIKKGNNRAALDRALAGIEAGEAAADVLAEEVKELKLQAQKGPAGAADLLTRVEGQLASLRDGTKQLQDAVKGLRQVADRSAGREDRVKAVNTQVGLLLDKGQADEALAAYDQLLSLVPADQRAKVQKLRDDLAAEWRPKDPAHDSARGYLLRRWPALATVADLKDSLPLLRDAVKTCKAAGDKYAFRQFRDVLGTIPAKLDELQKDREGDKATADAAKAVRAEVGQIEQEVVELLKGGA